VARLAGLGVAGWIGVCLWLAFARTASPTFTPAAIAAWARGVLDAPTLAIGLYPILAPVRLALAPGGAAFAAALPGTAAVLLLHVAWVLSLDVPFEEQALEHAQTSARRVQALRSGLGFRLRGRPRSYRLGVRGRPELALAWKGWVRACRFVTPQAVMVGALVVGLSLVASVAGAVSGRAPFLGLLALTFHPVVALVGPSWARGDLRRDPGSVAVLRALPLRGRQLLVGELIFPLAQLAALQGLLLLVAFLAPNPALPTDRARAAAVVGALAVAGLAVSALGLVVQHGLAAVFPALIQPPQERGYSMERSGMQILALLGGLTLLVLVLLPGVALGTAAYLLVGGGALALPLAAAAGAVPLAIATGAGIWLVGRVLDTAEDAG